MAKQKLKIESGGMPRTSDYITPPPPPPADEPTPISGYKSYLDPTTPGAEATFDSYFWNNPPLGLDPEALTLEGYRKRQRLAAADGSGSGSSAGEAIPVLPQAEVAAPTADMSFQDYLAGMGFGQTGTGSAGPDYSAYRAALTDQAQQINAQIQAMYNALGEEAGANVGRIQDIYGGASTGIGDVYDSAAANVADAYGSSQQQAADQLARLGIEAAAPAVVNPMALSQAEALSGLEQGRAGGQAATERFGSAASGFGSQMAQVAQQQGTEMNTAVLNALQNRLMDSLAAEQAGAGGGGGGGMSVRDQLALREAYNRDVLGELPLEERQFAFDMAQAAAQPANEYNEWRRTKFYELTTPQDGAKPLFTPEEAQAYLNALDSYMSPG